MVFSALLVSRSRAPKAGALVVEAARYAGSAGWAVEMPAPGWVRCRGKQGAIHVTLSVSAERGTFTVWPCPNPALFGEPLPNNAAFSRGRLQLQVTHSELAEVIEDTTQRVERWWSRLSERWGALDAEGITLEQRSIKPRTGMIRLSGTAGGIPFAVAMASWDASVVVTATLPSPLPGRVVARGAGNGAAPVSRVDPVVGTVAEVYGSDPDRLRAVLAVDAVRAPLVEALHRFPGSRVYGGTVELVADGEEPVVLVRLASELAGALGRQLAVTERQAARAARPLRDAR